MIYKKTKILLVVLAAVVVGLVSVRWYRVRTIEQQDVTSQAVSVLSLPSYSHSLTIGTTALKVAIADTEALREQGLSGTQPLAEGRGMLFVYDAQHKPYFWMKDMNYPLDMIWIGVDRKVVDVSADADPKDFPKTYSPRSEVQYVLEVPAGFAKAHVISEGTPVSF